VENLLFVALVAAVALIRFLVQAAENKKNRDAAKRAEPDAARPIQRAPAETEEERIRRFMEALGVPKGSAAPPRKVTPRAPTKIPPIDPFPLPRSRGDVPPITPSREEAPPIPAPQPAAPLPLPTAETSMLALEKIANAPAESYDVRELASAAHEPPVPGSAGVSRDNSKRGLRARLATAEGLRDAIILREIFGPPRSMQPAELTRPL
jgi:hypothetical protein